MKTTILDKPELPKFAGTMKFDWDDLVRGQVRNLGHLHRAVHRRAKVLTGSTAILSPHRRHRNLATEKIVSAEKNRVLLGSVSSKQHMPLNVKVTRLSIVTNCFKDNGGIVCVIFRSFVIFFGNLWAAWRGLQSVGKNNPNAVVRF